MPYNNRAITDPKAFFQNMLVLFYALAFSQVLFFIIAFLFKQTDEQLHRVFQYIILVWIIFVIVSSPIFYLYALKRRLKPDLALVKKLEIYRSANIIKLAFLQGAALLSIVSLLIVGKPYYAYLFLAVFMAYLINRPSVAKCIADLNLNAQEQQSIRTNKPFS
jgi:hypothetical protein